MARICLNPRSDNHLSRYVFPILMLGLLFSEAVQPAHVLALQVNPSALTFTATQGSGAPAAQTLTIWKSNTVTKTWTVTAGVPWISATPSSGSITTERDQVQVMVNPGGLASGSYSTSLMITTTSTDGRIRKTAVPVTLTVSSTTTTGGFTITPRSLSYTTAVNGPNQVAGVTITNTSSASLTVTWFDNINWLVATSGDTVTMPPGGSAVINHTASPTGLTTGTYTGTATITGAGITKQVPISMTVTTGTTMPVIGFTPTALSFNATVGGTNPAAQTIGVSNTGGGTLSWNASDNAAWLTLSPQSGANAGTITLSVNTAGLAAGTYNATVTLAATGATTKTVPVSLTVTAASTTPSIGSSPASLSFSGMVGGSNPASQTLSVTNTGGGTLTWTASDNAAWLTLSPTSGTNSGAITASVNLSGLAAGTYNGTITIAASGAGNSPRTIPVSLTLSTPSAGTATLSWNATSDSDLAGYKVYRATTSGGYGAPLATLNKTTTSYVASGLQTGTTYFFVITAYDTAGNESAFSNEVSKSIF